MSTPEGWTDGRRRADLILHILQGRTTAEHAAAEHGLAVSEIIGWQERFLAGGQTALSDRLDGRNSRSRSYRLALAALVVFWLVLRVAYFNGYYTEDAPGYVTDAIYIALGNYHARDYVTGLNVGTYLPVALPLALFGKSEAVLSLWPLLCSLIGLLSLAGAAGMLFGRPFGLLAGLLYATYPGDVFFSTVVMPDAIQAGWLAFSVFMIVSAFAGFASLKHWKLAAAGVAMGVCHLVRANGPILLPVGVFATALFAWRWKRDGFQGVARATCSYLGGWLLVQLAEGLAYLWAAGDFFHRFHVVNRHYGTLQSIGQWGLNTSPTTIPFSIFPPLLWLRTGIWGALNQDQAYHGFIFCLALAGAIVGALALASARVPRSRRLSAGFAAGAFWAAWPLIYHQFGSQSVTHFVPIHRLSRHLVVYAPGAVFVAVAACAIVADSVARWRFPFARRAVAASAAGLLIVHLAFNWEAERIASASFHRIKSTYVRIRERLPANVQTIVGDPGDLCFFDFWLNPIGAERVRMAAFANYTRCDQLPGGVVLTRSNPGWEGLSAPVIQDTVRRLPCLLDPPAGWRLLYEGFPEKIFIVPTGSAMR